MNLLNFTFSRQFIISKLNYLIRKITIRATAALFTVEAAIEADVKAAAVDSCCAWNKNNDNFKSEQKHKTNHFTLLNKFR